MCIEVSPHPAMIALFRLGRILKYKGGEPTTRQAAFTDLLDNLEAISTLGPGTSERWGQIRSVASNAPRQCDLDRIEDEVKAVLCAHLAWLWHHQLSTLQVYGDVESGYIVAPPPPTHAPTPRDFVAKPAVSHPAKSLPSVTFCVSAVPATLATAGERPGRRAVEDAAAGAMGTSLAFHGRFSVGIDFVLPPPTMKGQVWYLDNLIKPTIDALGRSSASVQATGARSQPDDEWADRFVATKRTVKNSETPGATITCRCHAKC